MSNDSALRWLLRFVGGIELCAIPFLLLPVSWMAEVHERWLGLGHFPREPIAEYLARGLTALYAVHGAVVFFVSQDVGRYRPLIRFLGGVHIALGLTVAAIGWSSGLPWWWVLGEGPGIVIGGVLVLMLSRESIRIT